MATRDKKYLTAVHSGLVESLDRQSAALPEGFNKARFTQNCMSLLQDGQQDYSKCEPQSVVRTLLKGAFLGLDFFNGECYAIPYGNQCNFQTDYKGEIKLSKRFSSTPIQDIYAKVVREGDEFVERIEDGKQTITFNPIPFNDGNIIGAFAVCLYKDGSMIYDTMSKSEIDHTRNAYSKAANSKAWKESYGEMCKKTVLRRLCKLIDLDFDNAEQRKAFEDASPMEVNKGETYEAKDVYAGDPDMEKAVEPTDVLEGEFTEVNEDGEEETSNADE